MRRTVIHNPTRIASRSQRGFTLTEVIVAVLILAIGVLGVSGLQVISMQQNRSALLRGQALQIGNDMLDRMRANQGSDYAPVEFDEDPPLALNCVGAAVDCSELQMATFDIAQWKCSINSNAADGMSHDICTDFGITGAFPSGEGDIQLDAVGVHQIRVRWTDNPNGATSTITLGTRTR